MKTKTLKTACSDWMLGWGYGGYNKLGQLTLISDDVENGDGLFTFQWKGHAQGRHGQIWTKVGRVSITSDGKTFTVVETDNKCSLPVDREVLDSVNTLIRMFNQMKGGKKNATIN
jgi:hypothetical protein